MLKDTLKNLRKKNNLSQKDLSEKLSVAPSTISMYEKGNRMPNDEQLKKIASFFNVSIDYLLGYSTNPQSFSSSEDEELIEYLEELRSNPNMRILFDHAKNATKEELRAAIALFDALNKQ